MDDQIAAAVEMKLASANARIEELQTALLEVKDSAERSHASITSDMGHMKQEQSFTRQKLQEVGECCNIRSSNHSADAEHVCHDADKPRKDHAAEHGRRSGETTAHN
jgi:hypothetical protein